MGKLFGTDGVRGVAGKDLTCELALQIGRGTAAVLTSLDGHRPKILIGKDTRVSGDMLESTLAAGLCSVGADVELLGVIPTPGVAYLVRKYNADAGIMISASHNPMEVNGIKIFKGDGYKLPDEVENQIEAHVFNNCTDIRLAEGADIGRIKMCRTGVKDYVDFLQEHIDADLTGLKVLFDCANGASSATAARLFDRFPKLQTDVINADPDGVNINDKCGSTHIDSLAAMVKAGGYDIGIAFDGDADRCLAVDENGVLIDGDQIMAACGLDRKGRGALPGDTVVATVMSNLGLHVFAKEHGLKLEITDVGDRNVLERMLEQGYVLGGEQSGHMIFTDYATTGDGQLTALQVLSLLKESGKKASELFGACARYPQVLINVPVADNDVKKAVMASQALWDAVKAEEEQLAGSGRILVRPSGTEALMRVMVEAKTEDVARQTAQRLAQMIPSLAKE